MVFHDWEDVDKNLYATRGQLWDQGKELLPDTNFTHTVTTNRSLQEYKLYDVTKTHSLLSSSCLCIEKILNALYVVNNRAKKISEFIEKNKNNKRLEGKINKLKSEREDIYIIKSNVLMYLYGEDRIELKGYHTIGNDKRKAYSFESDPYSFHNWAENFNAFSLKFLGHLPKFPKGSSKKELYNKMEARDLLIKYTDEYIKNETNNSD